MEQKPNFFVVGAPKSGTTSLYIYLKQHPEIFLPEKKELNYFCTDLHFNYPLLTQEQFMKYYASVKQEKGIGEVSVWNLLSAAASQEIHRFNDQSKIIIMLRNPVDMMYALFNNHVYSGNENILDFKLALAAEEKRISGAMIPSRLRCPKEGLLYRKVAKYSLQVERYYRDFGNEKVMVILFDDFVNDTKDVFRSVLRFLNVDDSFLPELKPYNVSKIVRSNFIKQLTIDPPLLIKQAGRIFFPHQSSRRDWLMKNLWKFNSKKAARKEMDVELRKELVLEFADEIRNLQQFTGRDLFHWLL